MNEVTQDIPAIQAALESFKGDPTSNSVGGSSAIDLRKVAANLQILPLILDMAGCLGIRPNREVLTFMWDDPQTVTVEHDERIRNMVLFRASQKYPQLAALKPIRPFDAKICPHCSGVGKVASIPRSIICYCGGLGWVPVQPIPRHSKCVKADGIS
ncbi:MAG TPA: hypothetical protein VE988_23730 [Gemmataceae bacterium]|nr:hypothetical protein [Gemmataceae bacterium]